MTGSLFISHLQFLSFPVPLGLFEASEELRGAINPDP